MENVPRRLSQNQLHLLHRVRDVSRQRADEVLRNANLTTQQMEELERAKQRLREARLVININRLEEIFRPKEPVIDSILRSGRLYNLFEIDNVARDTNPSRIRSRLMAEFKIYGATPDVHLVMGRMSITEHPNYAALDYIGDPIVFSSPAHYGRYRFRLENEVKRRCTFTPADGFVVELHQVYLWDDIDGVLATQVGFPPRYWFEWINLEQEPFGPDGSVAYIEAQILGGVFVDEDIEALYYPETDYFDNEFFPKLRRLARRFFKVQRTRGLQVPPLRERMISYKEEKGMYKVIASNRLRAAVLEKENGELCFSWGPDMVRTTIKEEDLQKVHPNEMPHLTRYYVQHDPPIEIEKLEDWPSAVQ